jgi:hypothetical protein
VTCWHWDLLCIKLIYQSCWNVAAFCNNITNARRKWKLVISVHYVVPYRFEWLLCIWELECVMLNVSFVAPFLCNLAHSPLQTKAGKTTPKCIMGNAFGLVCIDAHTPGIRVIIKSVMCDWWKCCSILTSWVAGLKRGTYIDFVEKKLKCSRRSQFVFIIKSGLTVLCCGNALIWILHIYVCFIMKPAWNSIVTKSKKPKQLTSALWELYFNYLGVYLCCSWMNPP